MNSIRVAMLIQRYLPFVGGAERQLASVMKRLPSRGIEPFVVTRLYDALPPTETIDGIVVHRMANPGPRVLAALGFTANALGTLRRERPDILHAHELLSPSTTALAAKALFRLPIVAKILRGGTLGDIAKLAEGGPIGRMRLAAIKRSVDAFAVISAEIDAELVALGVEEERRVFIPNGVDVDRFRPAALEEKAACRRARNLPDGPLALFAGRLEAEKQIDRVVRLWPRIRDAVPGAGLVIVGEGSLGESLRAGAGEGVHLVGRQDDMDEWYRLADLFVLPSAAEGLSNALLEAMATGLVCVATEVGGAADLFGKNERGFLVPPSDDAALEAALIHALRAPGGELGSAARRRVVEAYSLDATVDRLAGLYQRLAARRRTG